LIPKAGVCVFLKPSYVGIFVFETIHYTYTIFGVYQSSEAAIFCFVISYWFRETCNARWLYSELRITVNEQQDS